MRRAVAGVVAMGLCSVAVWGCVSDSSTAPPLGELALTQLTTGCSNNDVGGQPFGDFNRHWFCGEGVSLGGHSVAESAAVANAIDPWRTALQWDVIGSVPSLYYRSTSPDIEVSWINPTGGLCGETDPGHPPTFINIKGSTHCNQAPNPNTDAAVVLVHELTHVLGFADPGFEDNDITPHDCVAYIDKFTHVLNSHPCAQEVEVIFRGYGLNSYDPAGIWTKSIVTRPNFAAPQLTVQQGQSVTGTVSSISVDNPQTANGTVAGSFATYAWESSNGKVLVVGSPTGASATLQAIDTGVAFVRVTVAGTTLSNTLVGTVAHLVGDSIRVVVTDPPPPPPPPDFAIQGITGVPSPVTRYGHYSIKPEISGASGGTLWLRWQISYSTGHPPPVDTGFDDGPGYYLWVPEGSYRITITVTARDEVRGQTKRTIYLPVCTSGDGGGVPLLRAQLDSGAALPEAGTDAVGGC